MTDIVLATKSHIIEILAWLKQELEETEEGFYCERELIVESQQQGEVYCAIDRSKVVGFIVLNRKTPGAFIDILEIKQDCRGKGFGKRLALYAIDRLFESGAEYIKVQCAPRRSEPFWKSLGFLPSDTPKPNVFDNPRLVLQKRPKFIAPRRKCER